MSISLDIGANQDISTPDLSFYTRYIGQIRQNLMLLRIRSNACAEMNLPFILCRHYVKKRASRLRQPIDMTNTLPAIQRFLENSGLAFEVWPCDPELADTAVYCEHYGISLENSANAILVRSKTGDKKFVLCVLRATDRLNTNHTVRKKLGARKVSFASADETREITGMEIGGVTPIALPENLPIWIDDAVMQCEYVGPCYSSRPSKWWPIWPCAHKNWNRRVDQAGKR
jgi:prolyl-tRNA editing enzyme YbaK/EbsC (Cys-tRNA(Pro) deacylase)